ncbi:hypothetical protein FACS1894211_12820 [Clostridia bacterium]|nr:hypothetical protein FACS1894211_12820 [Clostridia bacterium]
MSKKGIGVFSSVALFLGLFMGIAFLASYLAVFINNGQKNFYVQYGSAELSGTENLILPLNANSIFYCKYVVPNAQGYNVKIVPSEHLVGLDFKLNGEWNMFRNDTDLTAGFDLVKCDGYFILTLDHVGVTGGGLYGILGFVYGYDAISDVPDLNLREKAYFTIAVTSHNNDTAVNINFSYGYLNGDAL